MNGMNVLVTGGLGFIGSHIVNDIVDNNNVFVIDDLSEGNINNLENQNHKNLNIIKENLLNLDLDSILKDIDFVFHLAAMASVPLSISNPLMCNNQNVLATVRLLDASRKNDVEKIIFSSSAAVYGETNNLPISESNPTAPMSPYAASKASCELYLKSFYESYGLNYVALRYFNVFGPKQNINSQYSAVIPTFVDSLINNKQPIIYGDGEQTRDFVYVGDVVKANIMSCESNFNGIVNVASGKSISVNNLFNIIKNTLCSDLDPIYLPERPGDIKHSLANINNLKRIGCHINLDNFENYLVETIEWFKYK